MKTDVYNQKGEKMGILNLPDNIFDIKPKEGLFNQVVRYYEILKRSHIAKTKDRSEVRGGGAKPWRQKGTGRARHGSRRSPIWIGGGVTFGPTTEKKYDKKINKKMLKKALFGVLSEKLRSGNILFLEKIEIKKPKTKEAEKLLEALSKIKKDIKNKKTIFVLENKNENFIRAFSNIKNVFTIPGDSLNSYFLMKGKYLVIEKGAIKKIQNNKDSKDKKQSKDVKKTQEKKLKKPVKRERPDKKSGNKTKD